MLPGIWISYLGSSSILVVHPILFPYLDSDLGMAIVPAGIALDGCGGAYKILLVGTRTKILHVGTRANMSLHSLLKIQRISSIMVII